jgi:AcrR family transcriptional regulator
MVQKSKGPPRPSQAAAPVIPKRRGRPRAYEPEVALGRALDLFRKSGFAATSLDDLSAATGMNRPSLYGAFGDKRELYIKSYQRYRDDARAATLDIFREEMPLRQRLQRIYAIALDIYLSGEAGGLRSGRRSRHPRHGAGRFFLTRQGVRGLLSARPAEGRTAG